MARLNVDDLFGSSDSRSFIGQGPRPSPSSGPRSPFSGLFGRKEEPGRVFRGPEPERGYYISGDRLADFLGQFDRAIEKEEADPQVIRAWAALVDFEGAQRTEMRGALDWITPEFRFWSTLGLAASYVLLRHLRRLSKVKAKPRTQARTQAQAPAPGPASGPQTPQTGPPEPEVKAAARSPKPKCEICNVELIELDASTAVCPSCNHEYRRG